MGTRSIPEGSEVRFLGSEREAEKALLTSNDWAYQSLTLFIEGISLRLCGSSSSSFTLWANRTGSSSTKKKKKKHRRGGGRSDQARDWEVVGHTPSRN